MFLFVSNRFTCGTLNLLIFFMNFTIKKKYVKLLTKYSVKDNINCEDNSNISKILKCDLYVL